MLSKEQDKICQENAVYQTGFLGRLVVLGLVLLTHQELSSRDKSNGNSSESKSNKS